MNIPAGITVAEVWEHLESYQKARLHLVALERQGKRPSPLALAATADVHVETAKRELRRHRRQKGRT